MISWRRFIRRLAAGLMAAALGCGLAVGVTGAAQAAVPNYWGFALVQNPGGLVPAGHWAESVPSPTPTATAIAPGREVVRFPKIGYTKTGVVHVTAVIDEFAWCQARGWRPLGGAELVTVQCYVKGGTPQFVPFTVTFAESSGTLPGGLKYAYLYHTPAGIVTSFNSRGLANTVTTVGTGVWRVRLPGAGPSTPSGGVQLTAVNKTKPAICDVGGRAQTTSQQIVEVRCYSKLGAPMATGWTLSYQRGRAITGALPKFFGYTVYNKLACPLVPAPPAVNFNSAGATNSIACTLPSPTSWLVKLPMIGVHPDTVLVTALAPTARVCNLNTVWATSGGDAIVRDVVCYQVSGAFATARWLLSYDTKS
jgi:hypothetical protein